MNTPFSRTPLWLSTAGALLALIALCLPASTDVVATGTRCCVKAHISPPGSGCTLPCDPVNDCSGGGQGVIVPGACKDSPGTCNEGGGLTAYVHNANYRCEEYDCDDGGVECKWKKLLDLSSGKVVDECTGGCKTVQPGDPTPH